MCDNNKKGPSKGGLKRFRRALADWMERDLEGLDAALAENLALMSGRPVPPETARRLVEVVYNEAVEAGKRPMEALRAIDVDHLPVPGKADVCEWLDKLEGKDGDGAVNEEITVK